MLRKTYVQHQEEMIELFNAGRTYEDIGKMFGCRKQTVYQIINKKGEPSKRRVLPFLEIDGMRFSLRDNGYYESTVDGKVIPLHRHIYEKHFGIIPPKNQIHHINGIKHDNRIENLMSLTSQEHIRIHNGFELRGEEWWKQCTICGIVKKLSTDFYNSQLNRCKECATLIEKQYRAENPVARQLYWEKNKENINEKRRIKYIENKEENHAKQKAYREAHRDKDIAKSKAYGDAHREEQKAYNKAYHARKKLATPPPNEV